MFTTLYYIRNLQMVPKKQDSLSLATLFQPSVIQHWRHSHQHNDTQHKGITCNSQHNIAKNDSIMAEYSMLLIAMLNAIVLCYALC
jgi:hypothetical protein